MTARELAEKCGCSFVTVYNYIKKHKLNRLPTEEELNSRNKKAGRPKKYN